MVELTDTGKKVRNIVVALILVAAAVVAVKQFAPGLFGSVASTLFPEKAAKKVSVPARANLPNAPTAAVPAAGTEIKLPSTRPARVDAPEVRFEIWAWMSQMGLLLANGGPATTEGSLMQKYGVNLKLTRTDDAPVMQTQLAAFANELASGVRQPTSGCHFVAIMGDGAAAFLHDLNAELARLGPDYEAEVIGSCGRSRGEDKLMGPPEWRDNPQSMRGAVIAAYLRDGDWNIAMKYMADNGIPNNPDETTYDPDAVNWVNAENYVDAAQKYVSGYSETRPVVRNGKRTGETKTIKVDGPATWTPGDVAVVYLDEEKKIYSRGGLISVVSTKEYSGQMPNTIIGIKRWNRENRQLVEGMLAAIFDAGDMIKLSDVALQRACEIAPVVWKEKKPDYWFKYFKGAVERDKTGLMVELGGSAIHNLADNLQWFGLAPGSANLFAATYETFGDIVVQQYPEYVPNYPPVATILNTSYIEGVARRSTSRVAADMPDFSAGDRVQQVVSRRSWDDITFRSGSAAFTPEAEARLDQLLKGVLVARELNVELHGHTDSDGDAEVNMALSEQRAFAVKDWLESHARSEFPVGRINVVAHGEQNPVAPNSTPEGRARNRRVEVVMGS